MLVSDLDYELPEDLIAQHPLDKRDASRMLILDRAASSFYDSQFADFDLNLDETAVVVINNTRVFPARLFGKRQPSGARIELFLVRELRPDLWEVLARPARRLSIGTQISFASSSLRAEVVDALDEGRRVVQFTSRDTLDAALEELGQTPLPPYIKRIDSASPEDRERYQTIYASQKGAIAAPTAGLHFTQTTMNKLKMRGAKVVEITLHVGYGTFQPIRVENLDNHHVASESFEIGGHETRELNRARDEGHRIIAIGTTTTRALESSLDDSGMIRAGSRMADLTITPGYKFRVVNALLTNFHLPQSSLLALVVTFAGHELVMAAYRHAVESRYRFYSYGDCMLII